MYIWESMECYFILVEPSVPGNIGGAARAIKTMGFKHLRLVNPSDYLSPEARMLAHASKEILEGAEVFGSLKQALGDLDLSVATTAKKRNIRADFIVNTELPGRILSKGGAVEKMGIVFGREESGLSNEEIRLCDLVSTVPLKQSYPSLNLSQAVMLYAYTLSPLAMPPKRRRDEPVQEFLTGTPFSTSLPFRTMMDRAAEILQRLEVDRSPALYNRILERLALLGEDDVHLLLSVLSRLQ